MKIKDYTYEGVHFWSCPSIRSGAATFEFTQDSPSLYHCIYPTEFKIDPTAQDDGVPLGGRGTGGLASPMLDSLLSPGFGPLQFSPLINPAALTGLESGSEQGSPALTGVGGSGGGGTVRITFRPEFADSDGPEYPFGEENVSLRDAMARLGFQEVQITITNAEPALTKYFMDPITATGFYSEEDMHSAFSLQDAATPPQQASLAAVSLDPQQQQQQQQQQKHHRRHHHQHSQHSLMSQPQHSQEREDGIIDDDDDDFALGMGMRNGEISFENYIKEGDDLCDSDGGGEQGVSLAIPTAAQPHGGGMGGYFAGYGNAADGSGSGSSIGNSGSTMGLGTTEYGIDEREILAQRDNSITPGIIMGDIDTPVTNCFKPKVVRRHRISLATAPMQSSSSLLAGRAHFLPAGSAAPPTSNVSIHSLINPPQQPSQQQQQQAAQIRPTATLPTFNPSSSAQGTTAAQMAQSTALLQQQHPGMASAAAGAATTPTAATTTTITQLGPQQLQPRLNVQQEAIGFMTAAGDGRGISGGGGGAPAGFGPIRTGGTGKRPSINHSRKKVVEPGGMHTCQWEGCSMSFESVSELTNHLQICHTSVQTVYKCMWKGCGRNGKPFGNHSGLFRHLRYHTGDKPCKCTFEGCGFSSVDNGELRRHIKLVHHHTDNSWT